MFKLGESVVNSISGPISIAVLKPTDNFSKDFKKSSGRAPVFMLFGDEHESFKHICKKCTCSLENKSCCLEIFSEEMFEVLNNLSTKDNPVDFYIEYFIRKEEIEEHANSKDKYTLVNKTRAEYEQFKQSGALGPLGTLLMNNLPCFIKDYRRYSDFNTVCKFDKIRWQYSDIRIITYKSNYDLEGNLKNVSDIFLDAISNWISGETEQPIVDISEVNSLVGNDTKEFLRVACEMFNTPDVFIDTLLESNLLHRSLMFKQIRKLPNGYNNDQQWKQMIREYYNQKVMSKKEIKEYIDSKYLGSEMYKYFKSHLLGDGKYKLSSKRGHNAWEEYLIAVMTGFLDIYFIARSLKNPKGSRNPFLSIGYFGDDHCQNLIYFLTKITNWYTVDSKSSANSRSLRCLDVSRVKFDFNKLKQTYGLPETGSIETSSGTLHAFNAITKNITNSITDRVDKYLDQDSLNVIKNTVKKGVIDNLKGYSIQPQEVITDTVFDPIINHRIKSIFSKQR
jgi:hypothetical protein